MLFPSPVAIFSYELILQSPPSSIRYSNASFDGIHEDGFRELAGMTEKMMEVIKQKDCTRLIARLKICAIVTISYHKREKRHETHFNHIQKARGVLWKSPISHRQR